MRLLLVCATLGIGLVLALHFSMNAAIGVLVKNPRMSNALFWILGAAAAILLGATGYEPGFWGRLRGVPPWLFLCAVMGACIVFGVIFMIPRLGAGTVNVALLTGQVAGGLLIAHFGLFGSPVEKITLIRALGTALMTAGAALAILGRLPFVR